MLRIEFITQDDPLYILPFFDEFVRQFAERFEIVRISASPPMARRPRAQLLAELKALYGTVGLLRILMRAANAHIRGTFPKPRRAARYYTISQLCRAYAIPFDSLDDPNSSDFLGSIRRRAPDVLVSVACPYILKAPLLNIPRVGAINIHNAPLPRYRGMMPTFWQMYCGEEVVGTTVHRMVATVDRGEALYQGEQRIQPGETLDQLMRRSKRFGAHCVYEVLRQMSEGVLPSIRAADSEGTYFSFPTREVMKEFHRRGFRAI